MTRSTADVLTPLQAEIGEGPSWDSRNGTLTVVDIPAGTLHRVTADGERTQNAITLDGPLGAAVPMQDVGWNLLITRAGFTRLAPDNSVHHLVSVLADRPDLRFNDAKCDPAGRLFAGTLSLIDAPAAGTLYRLDDGPAATAVLDEVGLSNGLGWAPDGQTMYFVDTLSGRLSAFAYDAATAVPTSQTPLVQFEPGTPDGLCVDDDGGIWVALRGGHRVERYTPDGRLDRTVTVPVSQVTSCAFGGAAGDTLFITTAWAGLSPDQRAAQPHAGDLFAVRTGITGPPATPWRPVSTMDGAQP